MILYRKDEVYNSTLYRWVLQYTPKKEHNLQSRPKSNSISTLQLDETYIKDKGITKYLYSKIASKRNTLDFYLCHACNTKAAYRLLRIILEKFKSYGLPIKIYFGKIHPIQNQLYNKKNI